MCANVSLLTTVHHYNQLISVLTTVSTTTTSLCSNIHNILVLQCRTRATEFMGHTQFI